MEVEVINYLTKQLARNKCVLIMGPEFINIDTPQSEHPGSIHNYLAENKFKTSFSMDKYISEDGFFYFNGSDDKGRIAKDTMLSTMGEFYAGLKVTPSYEKLAQLPFNMIVSLSPDTLIVQATDNLNKANTYRKYSPAGFEDDDTLSDKKNTLIYNLFGDFNNYEQLIFSFDNLFDFLDKIFQNTVFPKFKERIAEANSFIFLGFTYDKWYLKLVFFLLNKFRNNAFGGDPFKTNPSRDCSKYAIFNYDTHADDQKVDFFKCNFGLTFSPEKEKDFIDELYKACLAGGILNPGKPVPADNQSPDAGNASQPYKIMYLGSSPDGPSILRQGEEFQIIKKELNSGSYTLLDPTYNLQLADILTEVNRNFPSMIYFSCHGSIEGDLYLSGDENAPVTMPLSVLKGKMSHLFEVHHQLQCIVFSACKSEIVAREISSTIPWCIGMKENVDELVSNAFTRGFFEGLISKKDNNIKYAFDNGIDAMKSSVDPRINQSYKIPVLYYQGTLIISNLQV